MVTREGVTTRNTPCCGAVPCSQAPVDHDPRTTGWSRTFRGQKWKTLIIWSGYKESQTSEHRSRNAGSEHTITTYIHTITTYIHTITTYKSSQHTYTPSRHAYTPLQHTYTPSQHTYTPSQLTNHHKIRTPHYNIRTHQQNIRTHHHNIHTSTTYTTHIHNITTYIYTITTFIPSQHTYTPSQHTCIPSQHTYTPSQHTCKPSQHMYTTSQHTNIPSQHAYKRTNSVVFVDDFLQRTDGKRRPTKLVDSCALFLSLVLRGLHSLLVGNKGLLHCQIVGNTLLTKQPQFHLGEWENC